MNLRKILGTTLLTSLFILPTTSTNSADDSKYQTRHRSQATVQERMSRVQTPSRSSNPSRINSTSPKPSTRISRPATPSSSSRTSRPPISRSSPSQNNYKHSIKINPYSRNIPNNTLPRKNNEAIHTRPSLSEKFNSSRTHIEIKPSTTFRSSRSTNLVTIHKNNQTYKHPSEKNWHNGWDNVINSARNNRNHCYINLPEKHYHPRLNDLERFFHSKFLINLSINNHCNSFSFGTSLITFHTNYGWKISYNSLPDKWDGYTYEDLRVRELYENLLEIRKTYSWESNETNKNLIRNQIGKFSDNFHGNLNGIIEETEMISGIARLRKELGRQANTNHSLLTTSTEMNRYIHTHDDRLLLDVLGY